MDEATHKKNFKPINLRDIFMEKNPSLARWIPGFVFRILSRILKIDFVNDPILYNHGYKKNVDFARATIDAFNVTPEVINGDHLKKGLIRDVQWQKSIITKATQTKRDVVPIHVSGQCTNFFYNLANIRKFLGIKANLEMFFLLRESYQHRNRRFVITFGKPIPFETFDKRYTPLEWAQLLKNHVYIIAEDPEREFSFIKNLSTASCQ